MDAYGATATLSKVAKVSVRNSRTLSISVFDNALSSAVEKAIRGAGLNLNPVSENDGRLTVPVPKPSKDTKEALRKVQYCCACFCNWIIVLVDVLSFDLLTWLIERQQRGVNMPRPR